MPELIQNQEKTVTGRFKITMELLLVYLATGIIILTFFDGIKQALFASLGYLALFGFLSVFVVMFSYTVYNIGRSVKILLS